MKKTSRQINKKKNKNKLRLKRTNIERGVWNIYAYYSISKWRNGK